MDPFLSSEGFLIDPNSLHTDGETVYQLLPREVT